MVFERFILPIFLNLMNQKTKRQNPRSPGFVRDENERKYHALPDYEKSSEVF